MKSSKFHILIVDDDNRILKLLKQFLQQNNFLVSTATSAKEAFECYVLVAVRLTCGWEVLIAVQAIDALPRLRLLFACSRALVFTSVARFIAISV